MPFVNSFDYSDPFGDTTAPVAPNSQDPLTSEPVAIGAGSLDLSNPAAVPNLFVDRTNQYRIPNLTGMLGNTEGWQDLNVVTPAEGGLGTASQRISDYLLQGNLGDADVAGYGSNVLNAAGAIASQQGLLGSEALSSFQNPLAFAGDYTAQAGQFINSFSDANSIEEAIGAYTGIENYQRADYTGGVSGKVAEHHTNMSDAEFNDFYSLLKPVADNYFISRVGQLGASEQGSLGKEYTDMINTFYQDPMVNALVDEYGLKPYRSTDDGSQYVYDPFTNREIRTYEAKYSLGDDVKKAATIAAMVAGAAFLGPAVAGFVAPAASSAVAAGTATLAQTIGVGVATAAGATLSNALITEASGGDFDFDLDKFATSAVLNGVSAYAQNATKAAESANTALNSLQNANPEQVALATQEAASANEALKVAEAIKNSTQAVNAIANEDYASALLNISDALYDGGIQAFTQDQLSSFGTDGELAGANIDDLSKAINSTVIALADGDDIESALTSGLKEYAESGGSLGDAGDAVKSFVADSATKFFGQYGQKALQAMQTVGKEVAELGSKFDDKYLQKLKKEAEAFYEPLMDGKSGKELIAGLRDKGSKVADSVVSEEGLFNFLTGAAKTPTAMPQLPSNVNVTPNELSLVDKYAGPVSSEELAGDQSYFDKLWGTV